MPQAIPGFIERQERQRTEAMSTIDSLLQRCADEDRDPTEVEEATLTDARTRLERAESVRSEWVGVLESAATHDEQSARVQGALARSHISRPEILGASGSTDAELELPRLFRSAGEYLYDYVEHSQGRTPERLQRAIQNQLVADNLGIVPTPIVGPVVDLIARARPVVASVSQRPLPAGGRSFTRPKITQHTDVGQQAAEKTELPSAKLLIDPLPVSKQTYGGTLDISFQNRDWTDPAILQIVVDDLATVYARQTEQSFSLFLEGQVTATGTIATWDGPGVTKAIAEGAAAIVSATDNGVMPDTLWVSPDIWAALASLCDTTGRPLFPQIGPSNAAGNISPSSWTGNIYGLRLVVGPFLPVKTMILGVAALAEFYETIGGQLSVTEPSILGFVVAYYGYVAWVVPAPEAFVQLSAAPGTGPFSATSSSSASSGK